MGVRPNSPVGDGPKRVSLGLSMCSVQPALFNNKERGWVR